MVSVYWARLSLEWATRSRRTGRGCRRRLSKLFPLYTRLGKPEPGGWLDRHVEFGQTYSQYLRGRPRRVDVTRRVIYVQPLGQFNPAQEKIVRLAAQYLGLYFDLPVTTLPKLRLDVVPSQARRKAGSRGSEQLLTTYILHDVLPPRLSQDAAVLIALTAADLWPGEGWNYVFGQASLSDRVGVWSLHRFGDAEESDDAFRQCLRRTLKTASHETGHMFSMAHCTLYRCNMNGSNHLQESDRTPLEMCPHCLAKLCYATGADPVKRCRQLSEFYKANGFLSDQQFCERSLQVLRSQ